MSEVDDVWLTVAVAKGEGTPLYGPWLQCAIDICLTAEKHREPGALLRVRVTWCGQADHAELAEHLRERLPGIAIQLVGDREIHVSPRAA